MVRSIIIVAVAVCLTGVSRADDVPKKPASDLQAMEGLWHGAWGGGEANGAVFQPVIAELVVQGDRVELHGFRNVGRLTGTIRLDPSVKRARITPAAAAGGPPAPQPIDYTYDIQGDRLTLTDRDKVAVRLQRQRVAHNPLANAQVQLVAASGINDAGDLLVTEFIVLRAGQGGATFLQPEERRLKTGQAAVLLVQETGLKKITVPEARGLIRKPTPVVVAYRPDERPSPHQFHELWKDVGPPRPDGEAVGQTFARMLRPGTLVFVLSVRENVPVP